MSRQPDYSEKYADDTYEYRHVRLPPEMARCVPRGRLISEDEWRGLGIQMSRGWTHFMLHRPEPNILLFRRRIGTDPVTGKLPDDAVKSEEEDTQSEN